VQRGSVAGRELGHANNLKQRDCGGGSVEFTRLARMPHSLLRGGLLLHGWEGRLTVAAPDRSIGREINGVLGISGDVGKEGSAHKPGSR